MVEEIAVAHRSNGWAVVVVCESQRDEAGRPMAGGDPVHIDAHGHAYYQSAGAYLAREVQSELGLRARYERPGSLQRAAAWAISETDAAEANAAGAEAVRLALADESDVMVAIHRGTSESYSAMLGTVALSDVAHRERSLPDDFIGESEIDVAPSFLNYAQPLIGGPLPPLFRLRP